jgi:sec-independent protein translocase protein TatA
MPNLKGWEIVIILALLLLLFGAKRLPDAARGLGRSLRIFKAETKGLREDDKDRDASASSDSTPTPTREIEGTIPDRETVVPRPTEHETRER